MDIKEEETEETEFVCETCGKNVQTTLKENTTFTTSHVVNQALSASSAISGTTRQRASSNSGRGQTQA